MRRPASGKRPTRALDQAVLVRWFAGSPRGGRAGWRLPFASAAGRTRQAEWLEDIARTAAGRALKSLLKAHPPLADLLGGIAAEAQYLWDLVRADPARFVRLLTHTPEIELANLLAKARDDAAAAPNSPEVMRILRRMKAEAALLIALADIGGVWPLARVTAALTEVAETALGVAIRHLLGDAAARGKLALPDPQNPESWLRLRRAGDGKNGRVRAEFLQRYRSYGLFRSAAWRRWRPILKLHHSMRGSTRDLVKLLQQRTPSTATFSASISGSAPIHLPLRLRSRPTQRSIITKAGDRTGSARR